MQTINYYKEKLFSYLDEAIKKNKPEAVLLSGGIDSSSIAYLGKKYKPELKSITVVTRDTESPDQQFAKKVSRKLKIKEHIIAPLDTGEIPSLVKKAVLILGNFNIYWASAAIVLLRGLEYAKINNIEKVATGEGSDDLFGSFPVMLNWKNGNKSLQNFIEIRKKDIDIMTQKIADSLNVKIVMPFHDKRIINLAFKMPLKYKIKKNQNGKKVTKYVLREAFKNYLPTTVTNRPQTMAFIGASTLDLLLNKYKNYTDIEKYRNRYKINFSSGLECYLFDILRKGGKYKPATNGNRCIYCRSKLRAKNSVHCTTCGTLQYKKKMLTF